MLNILFWNINKKKSLYPYIASLAYQYDVDIIVLAECDLENVQMVEQLLQNMGEYQYAASPEQYYEKVQVFTKFDSRFIEPLFNANRYSIRHLKLPGKPDILLGMVHLRSKLHSDINDQQLGTQKLVNSIEKQEQQLGHNRTILLGDFNMNPFDPGIVSAGIGLHAVMSRERAGRLKRQIDGDSYKFFYNPMWRLMGDERNSTPGTYHYVGSSAQEYFWHTFDQILIRPSLIDWLPENQPQIISKIKTEPLLNVQGIPDKNKFSDHLPLFVSLEF